MDHKRHCTRATYIQALPEEVLQIVFSHLIFEDKCRCCLVSPLWNRVLRRPVPELWREIQIDLALVVRRVGVEADRWQDVCKWFAFRSGGIRKVRFRAIMTLEDDSKPIKELVQVLNEEFAFFAGALTWTRSPMYIDLSFKGATPFVSRSLTSSNFLTHLAPYIKSLDLRNVQSTIPKDHFLCICQLSGLEVLQIDASDRSQGLRQLPEELGLLKNLRKLELYCQEGITYLPDSISKLERLEEVVLEELDISALPPGISTLTNLRSLTVETITGSEPLEIPFAFSHLKGLSELNLRAVNLVTLPDPILMVTSLISVDLSRNGAFTPAALAGLSTLTNLRELLLEKCGLLAVPPQLGHLQRLEKLSLSYNRLQDLPEEMEHLQHLRQFDISCNRLKNVPKAIQKMTAMQVLDLRWQDPAFALDAPLDFMFDMKDLIHFQICPGALAEDDTVGRGWDSASQYFIASAQARLQVEYSVRSKKPFFTTAYEDADA
eukprot:jgi/Botrbrau1/4160/Bobra.0192s0028.1